MSKHDEFSEVREQFMDMSKDDVKKFIRVQIGSGVKGLDKMSISQMIENVIIPAYHELAQEQFVDPEPEDAAELLMYDLDDFLEFGDEDDFFDEDED